MNGSPFGLNPLHARINDGEVRIARRACDLVGKSAPINVDRLSALLSFTSPPSPTDSLFESVFRVAPDATSTVHRDGSVDVAPKLRALDERSMPLLEAADGLWSRLVSSVAAAVTGAKRVAVLTGGGVDSSALLAAAIAVCRGATGSEVAAIALHFSGAGDDRPYLRDLERSLGIVAVKVSPSEGASSVMPLLTCPTMPMWSWSSATDLALLRAAHERGADVALVGFGGDDLLDGSPRSLADDLTRRPLDAIIRAARLSPSETSRADRIVDFVVRPMVGRAIPSCVRTGRRRRALLGQLAWAGPTLRRHIVAESTRWTLPRLDSPSARFDALAKATYLADGLELCEEVAGHVGIRLAYPYLDPSLVEHLSTLPPTMLLHANRFRGLFRLAIRGRVPDVVRLRPTKANFLNAWRETLQSAGGKKVLSDLASVDECSRLGLVDRDAFLAEFEHLERDDATWTQLWPVLGVEGFLRARASLRAA